jgi:hypothetical protein
VCSGAGLPSSTLGQLWLAYFADRQKRGSSFGDTLEAALHTLWSALSLSHVSCLTSITQKAPPITPASAADPADPPRIPLIRSDPHPGHAMHSTATTPVHASTLSNSTWPLGVTTRTGADVMFTCGHEKPTKSSLGNAPRGLATRSRVATGHEARAACRSLLSPSVHPSRQPRPPHSPNPTCLILVHHPHPPSHHHTHHYPHSHPHEPTPPRHRPVNPRHLSPVTCHPSPLHPARASAYPTSPPRGFHFPDMPSPHHSKRPAGAVRRTRAAQRECERTGVGSGHRSGSR